MAVPQARTENFLLAAIQGVAHSLWSLLSSRHWAAGTTAVMALLSLLGVLLPQMPSWVRGDTVTEAAWLAEQRDKLGPFTESLHRLGLLDIFHTPWFAVGLAVMVTSVLVYLASRLPGIWATVWRPRKRVPDAYFQVAPQRLASPIAAEPAAMVRALRRRLYRVERFDEQGKVYLFADRFPWTPVGTLLSHGAVVLIILAAVVSRASGFDAALLIAEGGSQPVFPLSQPQQMQVQLLDAVGLFDEQGRPLEYRSDIVIYRQGEEVKRCQVTVNSPCTYEGYRFHQAAYFGYGAEVRVMDASTGNVIYDETVALEFQRLVPLLAVRDHAGVVVYEGAPALSLARVDLGQGPVDVSLGALTVAGESYVLGLRERAEGGTQLVVMDQSGSAGSGTVIKEGERAWVGGLEWELAGEEWLPAARVRDLPLPPGREGAAEGPVLQMSNAAYGTSNASAGGPVPIAGTSGPPTLHIIGVSESPLVLRPGESARVGDYEYEFLGQREFAGIEARRDRSDLLVWAAAGLLLLGLIASLWLPRRRLWVRIGSEGTAVAAQGSPEAGLGRELRDLVARAGAPSVQEEYSDDIAGPRP